MIRVLGTQRILMLVFLVAMNVAMAASVYMFLMPQLVKKERDLRTMKGQISTVQSDIGRMQVEIDQLAEQQARFEVLKKRGFLYNQSLRQAERVIEKIQDQAGVISAEATIEPGVVEDNEEAQKADYKILKSPVSIRIRAIDTVDIFRYIYLMDRFFPGHIAVQDIDIQRKAEVTGTILRSIASGNNPALVEADIKMTWRTMIPQSQVTPVPGTGQP